ncbi:cytokinin dehydrogenase 7-like [Curcuma longa]|uniref:cytokinin dehydrogenase 7-like n=1 Tax=Curcuma longa TaxID=136217 RepID=UPI003D9E5B61
MLPPFLLAISLAASLRPWRPEAEALASALVVVDSDTALQFSSDFGRLVPPAPPAAVLRPSSPDDIADLLRLASSSPHPFPVAARGHGHSIRGQALAPGGVVVDMAALGRGRHGRINVSASPAYVDAGGEQLWIDVLCATLEHGLAPRSWTDYLHLTVGGTLSNAGVSGQAFRHGPQISNVYEVDIITGTGEMVTCSGDVNSDLFYGVLGGLGQLGIITRARIAVEPAPTRVRWLRLIYTDFTAFTDDQERLISITDGTGFDYVEGSLLMDQTLINNWRSSFFSGDDSEKIKKLASQFGGAIYCLEAAIYYNNEAVTDAVDEKLASLLGKLLFVPGFAFAVDATYLAFLDRVREGELRLRAVGLWDVPHPWLNLFVPKSSMHVFESGVFKGILKANNSPGPVLIYPMNKNKWDERMSAVTPNEEIFYSIGLLRSATSGEWQELERQNEEILGFCHERGIELKQYLPHYTAQSDWANHFGHKWDKFVELKRRYDPKAILSPGQQIFSSPDPAHQDSIDLSVN